MSSLFKVTMSCLIFYHLIAAGFAATEVENQIPTIPAQTLNELTLPPVPQCETPSVKLENPLLSEDDLKCLMASGMGIESYNAKKKYLEKVISLITPSLNLSFKKFNIMPDNGNLAVFFGQLMHESGFFQYTTEIGSTRYYTPEESNLSKKIISGDWSEENFCSIHEASTEGGKNYFDKSRKKFACYPIDQYNEEERRGKNLDRFTLLKNDQEGYVLESYYAVNSYPSRWRGRGFIQLTHCINYLLYAQFTALYEACEKNKSANKVDVDCLVDASSKSKSAFIVPSTKKEISFNPTGNLQCTESELNEIIKDFNAKNHGLDIDGGGLLTKPYSLANICSPRHMTDSAAWFWTKGSTSCSALATGQKRYTGERELKPCNCIIENAPETWNAKVAKNAQGIIEYGDDGEPKNGECKKEKRSGVCGDAEVIQSSMTGEEQLRLAGASACINGRNCRGLDDRSKLYRVARDFFNRSLDERKVFCKDLFPKREESKK